MSLTVRILLGLILGIAAGALLLGQEAGEGFVTAVEPVGALWLNAIKMTVIPLVLALVVTGIAAAGDAAAGGGVTVRSLGVFAALLVAGTAFAVVASELILWLWPVAEGTSAALRAGADASKVPPATEVSAMLTSLVPSNIFAALAEGAMLPLVLFGLLFGFAVTRLEAEPRAQVVGLFRAIADAMMVIVNWVLWLAPIGVFALALSFGYRTGWAAAGAVAQYVAVVSLVLILQLFVVILPAAVIWGRTSPVRWVAAALPALAVAFSTQSSLATLPTSIKRAREALRLPEPVIDVTLPLGVALFRITSPAGNFAVVAYVAHLYGIELSLAQMAVMAGIALIGSLAVVGVASSATFFVVIVPMSLAVGIPIEILPLLLAVEVLPDLWRTVGNVAAQLAAATIVGRAGKD